MARAVAAIVGRPNVGKSTLFNCLVGARMAITDATAGTTRDRVLATVQRGGAAFDLVDTGGMGGEDSQGLDDSVELQIDLALTESDLLVLVVDIASGLIPADKEAARRIRRSGKPVLIVANKADNETLARSGPEFAPLGLGDPIVVSALHRRGIGEMLDGIVAGLGDLAAADDVEEGEFRLAVCGRQNSGKSTLVNAWTDSERSIVSDVPGTTRDSVDVHIRRGDTAFVAIDTAGLRRKRQGAEAVDFYSSLRTEDAIERADVVMLLIDAIQGPAAADRRAAKQCIELYKPVIIAVNKWDLSGKTETQAYLKFLDSKLPRMGQAPVVFMSASTGQRIWDAADVARDLWTQSNITCTTGILNRVVREAFDRHSPPMTKRGRAKFYYATQVGTSPPRFALFVNNAGKFDKTWLRYLSGAVGTALGFDEVPINLILKSRHKQKGQSR